MLVIRLTRIGKKNAPAYRVVLADKRNSVKGKFIEILGHYNPRLKTKGLKKDRILYWLGKGAQASPTVHNLLVNEKIVADKKIKSWTPKKKTVEARKAKEAEAQKAAAEAEAKAKEAAVEPEKKEDKEAPAEENKIEEKTE